MTKLTRAILSAIVSSLLAGSVHAAADEEENQPKLPQPDTVLMVTTTSEDGSQSTILWIGAEGRYRLQTLQKDRETDENHEGVEIFRDDALYLLNLEDNTYNSLTRGKILKAAEEQKRFTQRANRPPVVRELRETETIAVVGGKWPCRFWEVHEDGVLTQELCILPLKRLPTGQAVGEMIERYNALFADSGMNASSLLPWSDVEITEGLPVIVRTYAEGKLHNLTTVSMLKTDEAPLPLRYMLPPGMTETKQGEL